MTDSIDFLEDLLQTLRQTARILLRQAAMVGGEVHLSLGNQHSLMETRASIERCKDELRSRGIAVDDKPEDMSISLTNEHNQGVKRSGRNTKSSLFQSRDKIFGFILPVFLLCSYTAILLIWMYFEELERVLFYVLLLVFVSLYYITNKEIHYIIKRKVFSALASIFVALSLCEASYGIFVRNNNETIKDIPAKIATTKTLYVDTEARYFMQVYNCDDICSVYLSGEETPIIKIRYNQSSEMVDITKYLVDYRTKFKFEVINETLKISYGIKIVKIKDGQSDFLENVECGTSAGYGCNNDANYGRGVVVEIEYDFVKP